MNQLGEISVFSITKGTKFECKQASILTCNMMYPTFSTQELGGAARRMNCYYSYITQDFIRHCQYDLLPAATADYYNSVSNDFPVHEYEALWDYTVTYNQKDFLSLYKDHYEYTGGAHGSTIRSSDTWNVRNGCRIMLSDFFPFEKDYILKIQAEIIRQIGMRQVDNPNIYFENYPELVRNTFKSDQFYLTENGLAFYFQQYDIAPYVTGIPVFEIPF